MPSAFIYLLKLSVSLCVVFLFYFFILRKLTFYNHNRWYLLGYTLLAFFIPFINVSDVVEKNNWSSNNLVSWIPLIHTGGTKVVTASDSFTIGLWDILLLLFISGVMFMFFRLIVQLYAYRKMVKKAIKLSSEGMYLYQVNEKIIPFSFGNAIFINRDLHNEIELEEIIRHEMVHVKQKHSIDIIWSELFCIVNWFNPFAWMIRRAIRQNLEFIADNNVLVNGIDPKQYQYLLLKVIGNNQFSIAQKFNFSSLKKRIAMMNKLKSAKINLLRFLFVLPLLATILLAFRKQIGDNHQPYNDAATAIRSNIKDTIPIVTPFSDRRYNIEVLINNKKDNPLIIVSDKNKKEITRLTMDEWNSRKDYYDKLYGQLPPPPPPLPPPPPPESSGKLSFFKDFKGNIEYIEVWPTNGNVEKYSMSNSKEKEAFEKKYGKIPPPPPAKLPTAPEIVISPTPPTPPAPVQLPANVQKININNDKATVWLKNGIKENYDLTIRAQKENFENKYGNIIPPPPPPPAKASIVEVPAPVSVIEERKVLSATGSVTIIERPAKISTSIQGNPLYVLDGAIINKAILDNLNPATIATIDVLKGSSATALYGDKASEGVIVIKTKAAAATDKVYITANEVHQSGNDKNTLTLKAAEIEMKNSKELVILDGKELPADRKKLSGTFNVVTLTKDEATKKYGDKGKKGVMEITTIN